MRKTGILTKMLTWKQLSDELCAHFETDAAKLPKVVQTVLEVASEGQTRGMKQAAATPPKEAKPAPEKKVGKLKQRGRKPRVMPNATPEEIAAQKKLPSMPERVMSVMTPGSTMAVVDVAAKLKAKGWLPISTNPRNYVNTTLANHPELFERIEKGVYRLKPNAKKVAVQAAPSSKPAPRVAEAQGADDAVQKLSAILVTPPKNFEKKFTTKEIAKLLDVDTKVADLVLRRMCTLKQLARLGETTWRLRQGTKTLNGAATAPS